MHSIPKMSVTKPGREHQRAADQDQHAVGELAVRHPARLQSASAAPATPVPPSRLISQEPKMLSAMSSRIVHQAPITWPTWMIT